MNIKNKLAEYGITSVYHFTDKSNLKSIQENGLQSLFNIEEESIDVSHFGANDFSHQLDRQKGLDDYIHLSFIKDHPMLHSAIARGSIINPVWLEIDISVLLEDETLFCDEVANARNAHLFKKKHLLKSIDFDGMIYEKDFWVRKDIRKAEILVYDHIPLNEIIGVTYGK